MGGQGHNLLNLQPRVMFADREARECQVSMGEIDAVER
jgi:hypothetical protein